MPQHRRSRVETLSPTLNTVYAAPGMLELLTETGSVTLAASTSEALYSSAEVTRELVPTRNSGRRPEVWPLSSENSPINLRKFRYSRQKNVL